MFESATFSFDHIPTQSVIYFYSPTHYSFESAARYFWNMYENIGKQSGEYAEIFIKSNPNDILFSKGHGFHEDTGYRYHLNEKGILIVSRINQEKLYERQFNVVFTRHYAEFINEYGEFLPKLYELSQSVREFSRNIYASVLDIEKMIQELSVDALLENSPARGRIYRWVEELRRIHKIKREMMR